MDKNYFFSKLSWILNGNKYDSMLEFDIRDNVPTLLLYNTNDLCLNEEQFNALMDSIRTPQKLYVAQNDSEQIYEFDFPMSYDCYESLNLYSISYLTSDKFDWLVIIDEALESGVGVLASNGDVINEFSTRYKNAISDIQNLVEFHFSDFSRNKNSIETLMKILSLWRSKK